MERPLIFQWEVFLALLGVILVAVTPGSGLGPSHTNGRIHTFYVSGLNSGSPGYTDKPITVWLAPKGEPVFFGAPEHETPLDRLRAWLDKTFTTTPTSLGLLPVYDSKAIPETRRDARQQFCAFVDRQGLGLRREYQTFCHPHG